MCRWGCPYTNTTYMCKWCGTRYCRECLKGEFSGEMKEATKCRQCFQSKCQGQRVEYMPGHAWPLDDKNGDNSTRKRSASTAKKSKSAKNGRKSAKKRK